MYGVCMMVKAQNHTTTRTISTNLSSWCTFYAEPETRSKNFVPRRPRLQRIQPSPNSQWKIQSEFRISFDIHQTLWHFYLSPCTKYFDRHSLVKDETRTYCKLLIFNMLTFLLSNLKSLQRKKYRNPSGTYDFAKIRNQMQLSSNYSSIPVPSDTQREF